MLGRSAGTRRVDLRDDGTFIRSFVPVGDAFAGLVIPDRRIRRRRAHPRRAVARASLRRSAVPARVLRQHEERPPPLVRHGDVRQSREGRAPPGEAEVALAQRHAVSPDVEVVRTYLELSSPEQLRAVPLDRSERSVRAPSDISVDRVSRALSTQSARGGTGATATRGPTNGSPCTSRRPSLIVWECLVGDDDRRLLRAGTPRRRLRRDLVLRTRRRVHRARTRQSNADARRRRSVGARRRRASGCTRARSTRRRALPNYQARGFDVQDGEVHVPARDDTSASTISRRRRPRAWERCAPDASTSAGGASLPPFRDPAAVVKPLRRAAARAAIVGADRGRRPPDR